MNGNSAPNPAVAPTYHMTGTDIHLYDQLPPEFRRFVRELPIEAAAAPILEALTRHSPGFVMSLLERNLQLVMERLADELAEALAK